MSQVGEAVYTKGLQDFSGEVLRVQTEIGETNMYGRACAYTGVGRDDYISLKIAMSNEMTVLMREHKDAFFERKHVTADSKQNLSREHEELIRSEPKYKAACDEAMAKIGGTPVLLYSTVGHQQAVESSDHCGAAVSCETSWIKCYHGNYIKKIDECIPCKDCLSAPGTKAVRNGWSQVVGYLMGP